MKKIVTVVWQVLTCGQNGGDARPNPGQAYTLTRPSATLTRSRPLARPDGPSTGRIPSAASQAAEVSHPVGEGQEGGIVPRFLEDAGDGMSRTVNRQTSDEPWSSPLLGERDRARADVPASHPFIFKPGMPLATTVSILGASLILSCASVCRGALIAGWNFNNQATGTAPTSISADHGSGSLDLSGLSSSADAKIDGTSSGLNSGSDVAGNALALKGGTSEIENGKSIIFSLSMSGYKKLVLTYATVGTSTGFTVQNWNYSADGGANYISFASISVPTSYTTETVDFSSVSDLNNDSSILFELTVSGATGSTGSDHSDNIQFNADAVPEPPEWGAISALGLMGICGLREWRQRRCGEKLKSCPVK